MASNVMMIDEDSEMEIGKTPALSLKKGLCNDEVILRKRLPHSMPKRKNDLYVTRKTCFAAQQKRCHKLLYSDYNEIFIHGLGAAIPRAMNLALQLKMEGHGSLEVSCHTDTVYLVDDLEYEESETNPLSGQVRSQKRLNSAVHIRVYRPVVPLPYSDPSKKDK